MPSFSERKGLVAAKGLQTAGIDIPLRNGLWTAFFERLLNRVDTERRYMPGDQKWQRAKEVDAILPLVWLGFFKEASDTFPGNSAVVQRMRGLFMSDQWNRVYSLVEFILSYAPAWALAPLVSAVNDALKRENAAY
jgi:hypothetical protein